MARAYYRDVAQLTDANGFVKKVENPEVTVYQSGTTTPLVDTLYAADTGDDTTLANPFTAAADGTFEFYLETPKRVSVKIDGASIGLGTATKVMDPGNLNTGLYSSNGEHVATISDEGVFTAPGIQRGYDIYNVADYGLVTGSTSTNAAANTTALAALWVTVASAGGGTIYFPPGTWPLNATTLNHALGYGVSINLIGSGGSAVLHFYGTTGPFLNVATTSASSLSRCYFRDLRFQHASVVTAGATLQFNSVSQLMLENVRVPNAGDGRASMTSVRLTGTGLVSFRNCKFETRNDITQLSYDSLTPIGLDVATDALVGGLYMDYTNWDGCAGGGAAVSSGGVVTGVTVSSVGSGYTSAPTVSITGGGGSGATGTAVLTSGKVTGVTVTNGGSGYTSAPTVTFSGGGGTGAAAIFDSRGTGLRFVNEAMLDTVWFGPGTLIKDWQGGIVKTGGAGGIANVYAHGLIIDVCSIVNVQLDAPSGAGIGTWQFSGCWFASQGYNVILAETGGTVSGVTFENCYFTDAKTAGISIGSGVDNVVLVGNIIATTITDGGNNAVQVNGTTADILIANNRISAGSTAGALISISATSDPVVVTGNILRGGADADGISFGGSTGTSRVNANNAYKAVS